MTFSLASVCVLTSDMYPAVGGQPQLPDASAQIGSQQNAMMTGSQAQVKMPDGSLRWVTIDPTRWSPTQTPYVAPVGP